MAGAYKKLNGNQIKFRADKIKPYLADVSGYCMRAIFESCEVWERFAAEWLKSDKWVDTEEASNDDLFEQAIRSGLQNRDARIMQMYDDRRQSKENADVWAAKFEITPYRVADASLEQIVLEGDEYAIQKVMSALVERSRQDGCPEALCERTDAVVQEWLHWAEKGLKVHRREDEYIFEESLVGKASADDRVPATAGI